MCVQKSHSQFNCASEIEQLRKPLRRCFSVLLTWGQHQIPWDLRLVVFVLCAYLWCFSSLYLQQYIPHKEWKQFYFIKPINLQLIWLFGAWLRFGSRTTCSSSCFRCSLPQLSPSQLKLGQNIFSALCCLQTSSRGLVRNSNLGAVAPPADKQGCSISISPPEQVPRTHCVACWSARGSPGCWAWRNLAGQAAAPETSPSWVGKALGMQRMEDEDGRALCCAPLTLLVGQQ